jgi:thiamine biosynthesis lipoprotein
MQNYYLAALLMLGLAACQNEPKTNEKAAPNLSRINGKTMGSGYSIVYVDSISRDLQPDIEIFLKAFNAELSTYDSTSLISQLNKSSQITLPAKARYLIEVLEISKAIHSQSNGFFNPAIKPLVNYWGFGYKEKRPRTESSPAEIDSLLAITNFDDLVLTWSATRDSLHISKKNPRLQVEFNAIAPGYAADIIAELLQQKGINNYLIEVGGEILAKGQLPAGGFWRVGINPPTEDVGINEIKIAVELQNKALATSGNYRSFYLMGDKKIAHTISPKTGYPEQNQLLSVTIFAATCAEADGFATACMASGLEKTKTLLAAQPKLSAYIIYIDEKNNSQELWLNGAAAYLVK